VEEIVEEELKEKVPEESQFVFEQAELVEKREPDIVLEKAKEEANFEQVIQVEPVESSEIVAKRSSEEQIVHLSFDLNRMFVELEEDPAERSEISEAPESAYLFDYSRFETPDDLEWACPKCDAMPGMRHLLDVLNFASLSQSDMHLGQLLHDHKENTAAYIFSKDRPRILLDYPVIVGYCTLHKYGSKPLQCRNCGLYIHDERIGLCGFCEKLGEPTVANVLLFQRKGKTYRYALPEMCQGSIEIFNVPPDHSAYPGKGVRATRSIPANSQIQAFGGVFRKIVDLPNVNLWCFEVSHVDHQGIYVVDALEVGSEMRYINDPKGTRVPPNVKAYDVEFAVGNGEKIYTVIYHSLTKIRKGEELLIDYGAAYDWGDLYPKPQERRIPDVVIIEDEKDGEKEEEEEEEEWSP
jgi:hypothetical protein